MEMAEQQGSGSRPAAPVDWPALAGRLAALGSIAGDAAHRFNNLCAVIEGTLELLQADPAGSLTAQRLERLREAATRAQALAEGMVALARSQSGNTTRFDLGAWLMAGRDWLQPLVGATTTLALEIPPSQVRVLGDPDSLRVALTALMLNASAAVGSGGHVGLKLARRHREDRAMLILSVIDDGPGMAPAIAARAPEPFFTTRPPAAGLGLVVAQSYASRWGGHLDLSSSPGRGTVASLWLAESPELTLP